MDFVSFDFKNYRWNTDVDARVTRVKLLEHTIEQNRWTVGNKQKDNEGVQKVDKFGRTNETGIEGII